MAKKSGKYEIVGRVVDGRTRKGLAGLRVEAWDKDLTFDDMVGDDVTDARGGFRFEFDRSYFKELFLDRRPDIFFKVFRGGEMLRSTEDSILWNVGAEETGLLSEILIEVYPADPDAPDDDSPEEDVPAAERPGPGDDEYVVNGLVSGADGGPLAGFVVRASVKGLRRERALGEARADSAGRYEIRYRPTPRRASQAGPALIVRAYDPSDGRGAPVAESPVRFRAKRRETINLVAGGRQQSEFAALSALLAPLLEGAKLAELNDPDVDFLAGETGVGRELIASAAAAERAAALTGLPAPAFYDYLGRRRAGASGDDDNLWQVLASRWGLPAAEEERFRFVAQAGEVVRYDPALVPALLRMREADDLFAAINLALWDAGRWVALADGAWDGKTAEIPPWATGEGRAAKLRGAAAELITRAARAFPAALVERQTVSGQVVTPSGRPAAGVNVQAFHRGLNDTIAVSTPARSDAAGRYRLLADRRVLRRRVASLGTAPLQLQVRAWADEAPSEHGLSDVLPAAELPAEVNVAIQREVGPTEFETVSELIRAATGGAAPSALGEGGSVKWLAGATGLDPDAVRRFADAHKSAAETTGVSAEAHYALLHPAVRNMGEGLPASAAERLRAAAEARIVSTAVNASARAAEDWLGRREAEARAERLYAPASEAGPSTVVEILTAARLSSDDIQTYVGIIAAQPGADAETVAGLLSSAHVSKDALTKIRRAGLLTELVGADAGLVGSLIEEVSAAAEDKQAVAMLARRSAAEWGRRIGGTAEAGAVRRRARAIEAAFEVASPRGALMGRLDALADLRSPSPPAAGRLGAQDFARMRDFLNKHGGIELRGRGLKFQVNKLVPDPAEADPAVVQNLSSLQRLSRVASYSQALELLGLGYTSARDIASQTRESFVRQMRAAAGPDDFDEEEAAAVHRRATRQSAAALAVALGLSPHYQRISPAATGSVWRAGSIAVGDFAPDEIEWDGELYVTADRDSNDVTPYHRGTLDMLFGAPDACAVEPCQSVLGQAAYFVDLLQLLGRSGVGRSARDVLFERRQDLGEIELSCENSETPVPYIDLVIELLERDAVRPNTNTAPAPSSAYPQTTWAADELASYPEHLNPEAYELLSGARFPWGLPFHLWLEEAETYLGDLGLTRGELMRRLRKRPPTGVVTTAAFETAAAELGLSPAEREALTAGDNAAAPLWEYWGYWTAPDDWPTAAVGSVADLLRRHGLEHADLEELLGADYVNPEVGGGERQVSYGYGGDTCDLSLTTLEDVTEDFLARFHRFVRLWRRTGWSIREVDRAFVTFKDADLRQFLVRVAAAKSLASRLKLPPAEVLAFWGDLDTRAGLDRSTKPPRPLASQYDRTFQNKATLSRDDRRKLAWPFPENRRLKEIADPARAALGMSEDDYRRLPAGAAAGTLLSFISHLYRWHTLTKAAGLTVRETLALRAAGAPDPFAGPEDAVGFLDALDAMRRLGLSAEDLLFLLRHEGDAARSRRLADDALKMFGRVREVVSKRSDEEMAARLSERPSAAAQPLSDEAAATRFVGPALAEEMPRALGVSKAVASALLRQVRASDAGSSETAPLALARLFRSEEGWKSFTAHLSAASPEDVRKLSAEYPAWAEYVRMAKGAWLARRLKLSAEELDLGDGVLRSLNLLQLNELPAAPVEGAQPGEERERFGRFGELCALAELRERLAARGQQFRQLREASARVPSVAESWHKVVGDGGARTEDIASLVGPRLLAFGKKADEAPPSDWLRFLDAVELSRRLGVSAQGLEAWVKDAPTREAAADIRAAAAARRGPAEWKKVAPALRNRLREKQRSALVSYVVNRRGLDGPDALQNRYLVDVEMGAQQLTTRLALAVASVQRFVQRALLGAVSDRRGARLELQPDFEASWSWMKSHRTWQANRKVFLYPENFLAPELRDDKSPFFVEFEQALSQRDLTDQSIDDALGAYLQKLDDVARMEMMGSCIEEAGGGRLLHIVARTRGLPHQYYHRTWSLKTEMFSPWQRLDLDIEGDWVIPVVLDGRLSLYWVKHTKQLEGMSDTLGLIQTRPFPLTIHYPTYQDQYALSWSTRLRKGWSPKRTADRHIARPFFPFAPAQFAVRVEGQPLPVGGATGSAGLSPDRRVGGQRLRVGGVTLLPPPLPAPGATDTRRPTLKVASSLARYSAPNLPSREQVQQGAQQAQQGAQNFFNQQAENASEGFNNFVDSATGAGQEAAEAGGQVAGEIGERTVALAEWGTRTGQTAFNQITGGVVGTFAGAGDAAEGAFPNLQPLLAELVNVKGVVEGVKKALDGTDATYWSVRRALEKLSELIATTNPNDWSLQKAFEHVQKLLAADDPRFWSVEGALTEMRDLVAGEGEQWSLKKGLDDLTRMLASRDPNAWSLKWAFENLINNLADKVRGGVSGVAGDVMELKRQFEGLARVLTGAVNDLTALLNPPETLPQRTAVRVLQTAFQVLSAVGKAWVDTTRNLPDRVVNGGSLMSATAEAWKALNGLGDLARRHGWAGPVPGVEFGYFDVGGAGAKALRLTPPPYWAISGGLVPPGAGGLYDIISLLGAGFINETGRLIYSLFPGYPGLFEVPVLSGVLSTDLPLWGDAVEEGMLRAWPGSGYFLVGPAPFFNYATVSVNLRAILDEEISNRAPGLPDLFSGSLEDRLRQLNNFTAGAEATLEHASLANVQMRVVRPVPFGPFPGRLHNPPPTIVGEDRHGRSFLLKQVYAGPGARPPASGGAASRGLKKWDVVALHHPLPPMLIRAYESGGVEAVYRSGSRPDGEAWKLDRDGFGQSFIVIERPGEEGSVVAGEAARERLDFTHGGAAGLYNWELFYHLPMLLGARFTAQQNFEKAIRWYRQIFDPTVSSGPAPQRYWRFKHFHDEYEGGVPFRTIGQWLKGLTDGAGDEEEARLIGDWQRDPFNAHLVARLRPGAYERAVVMATVEALINWGDALFRQGTWESVNEATQLYLSARDILGERPRLAAPRRTPPLTYNEVESRARRKEGGIDPFGNALLDVESSLAAATPAGGAPPAGVLATLSGVSMLYFGIPANDKLLGYWDAVDDRLFKIRHSLDIHGKARPVFPGGLGLAGGEAEASGARFVDPGSAPATDAALPPYRFQATLQKAYELAGDVRAFGGALLSALEKRDAEALARLRAGQEVQVLKAAQQVRELQVEEAQHALDAAVQARKGAELRRAYYSGRLFINAAEVVKETLFLVSSGLQFASGAAELQAAILHALPDISIGASGHASSPQVSISYGSNQVGNAASAAARALSLMSSVAQTGSAMAGSIAAYERRKEDWDHQAELAASEIEQHDRAIAGAETRLKVARRELENHRRQVANSREVAAFMQEKFTREELYDWMAGQLSAVHFQSYLLAVDMARRAEACYRFERAPEEVRFITAERWETLADGLLGGERLQHDLRRMEAAYMVRNTRECELTKHVSLAQIDPVALLMLRQTGECYLRLTERLFDEDHPGHYLRRLKSVSLSIPAVAGPYTPVNCRLTLHDSRTRVDPSVSPGYPDQITSAQLDRDGRFTTDRRFSSHPASISAVVTSTGQNDGGLFELNLRDERYLPFEGAGAVGTWRVELPRETNRFDFASISDVVLHLRYTARDGGDQLRERAWEATFGAPPPGPLPEPPRGAAVDDLPRLRMFSARHDFPDAWHRFLTPKETDSDHTLPLALTPECFPFQFRSKSLAVSEVKLFLICKDEVRVPPGDLLTVTSPPDDTVSPPAVHESSATLSSGSSDFGGIPYAAVQISGRVTNSPGWAIILRKGHVTRLINTLKRTDDIEDLFILCQYSVER